MKALAAIFISFLGSMLRFLPIETQNQYNLDVNGLSGLQLVDADQYIRANITGKGGTVRLLKESNVRKDGETNWDGNKLAAYVNMIVNSVQAGYATSATAGGETDVAKLKYTTLVDTVPAALVSADLLVIQEGKTVLEVPFKSLFAAAKSEKNSGVEDVYELINLRLLKENSPIYIDIRFPESGGLDSAANHFVEVRLKGAKTAVRNA